MNLSLCDYCRLSEENAALRAGLEQARATIDYLLPRSDKLAQVEQERDALRAVHEPELGVCERHCTVVDELRAKVALHEQLLSNADLYIEPAERGVCVHFGSYVYISDDGHMDFIRRLLELEKEGCF